ncbi:hypothetical protein GCK72_022864 [Caenorhabditis remanei]|uniref:Uncharacterized protein n=1 Tax=Caenorhabditis remanei TaxID=31234 RepID=A0A6A5FUV5_CAERE|nr:hypothetical protein GCK72_022864 [Caenorhabditis remanei]KAF1746410.1 hypothetical protein GCK72_022864 [Caenorhabditis remanei]
MVNPKKQKRVRFSIPSPECREFDYEGLFYREVKEKSLLQNQIIQLKARILRLRAGEPERGVFEDPIEEFIADSEALCKWEASREAKGEMDFFEKRITKPSNLYLAYNKEESDDEERCDDEKKSEIGDIDSDKDSELSEQYSEDEGSFDDEDSEIGYSDSGEDEKLSEQYSESEDEKGIKHSDFEASYLDEEVSYETEKKDDTDEKTNNSCDGQKQLLFKNKDEEGEESYALEQDISYEEMDNEQYYVDDEESDDVDNADFVEVSDVEEEIDDGDVNAYLKNLYK